MRNKIMMSMLGMKQKGKELNKMITHLVVYGKFGDCSYVYDFSSEDRKEILTKRKYIIKRASLTNLSSLFTLHIIQSDSHSFDSIRKIDSYFKDVIEIDTFDSFLMKADKCSGLNSVDVASYLVRKYNLAPFALQKTLYYIYSDLLAGNQIKPFKATFVAFEEGPVDQDVYRENKHYQSRLLRSTEFERKLTTMQNKGLLLHKIHDVVEKYAAYFDRVWRDGYASDPERNYTHRDNTPWSLAYNQGNAWNHPINDSDIINFHKNETVF